MTTSVEIPMGTGPLALPKEHYLSRGWDLKSWLLTTDHKRIGLLYLVSITLMFALGSFYAALVRWNLLVPDGSHMSADTYNRSFTGHGVIMVFFFLIPSIPAVFGNFVLPMMVGARDLAFPRLNLASFYVYLLGSLITIGAMIAGGTDTGWTFYPPYSFGGDAMYLYRLCHALGEAGHHVDVVHCVDSYHLLHPAQPPIRFQPCLSSSDFVLRVPTIPKGTNSTKAT